MKIITGPESIHYQNPSLNRGRQVFTSFISSKEKIIFLDEHVHRLLRGADYLFPQHGWQSRQREVCDFIRQNFVPNHYFRAMIFDDTLVLSSQDHLPRPASCRASKAYHQRTPSLLPAFLKTPSYLIAESEINMAQTRSFDEVLFFSHQGILCEATTANVFLVTESQKILTPWSSSMVLEGVTRLKLMEFLRKKRYPVEETDITENMVLESSELWLTNSVSGIRSVSAFEAVSKRNELYQEICARFGRYGEKYE